MGFYEGVKLGPKGPLSGVSHPHPKKKSSLATGLQITVVYVMPNGQELKHPLRHVDKQISRKHVSSCIRVGKFLL